MFAMASTLFSEVLPGGTFGDLHINDLFVFIFNVMPCLSLFSKFKKHGKRAIFIAIFIMV